MYACVSKDIPQEMADCYALFFWQDMYFFFFSVFWVGVVSHLLFEARRKIIAHFQQGGEAIRGGIWEFGMQMDYVHVWQMGNEMEDRTW